MGPTRNRKTVEKIIQNQKAEKRFDYNRKPPAKLSKPIHFHIPVIKTLIDPMQWWQVEHTLISLAKNIWTSYIYGRALHRYRRGHGFKSRTGLNFFRPYFHYWSNSIHYCKDHFHSLISLQDLWIPWTWRSCVLVSA